MLDKQSKLLTQNFDKKLEKLEKLIKGKSPQTMVLSEFLSAQILTYKLKIYLKSFFKDTWSFGCRSFTISWKRHAFLCLFLYNMVFTAKRAVSSKSSREPVSLEDTKLIKGSQSWFSCFCLFLISPIHLPFPFPPIRMVLHLI